jgi:hypothetical protein
MAKRGDTSRTQLRFPARRIPAGLLQARFDSVWAAAKMWCEENKVPYTYTGAPGLPF